MTKKRTYPKRKSLEQRVSNSKPEIFREVELQSLIATRIRMALKERALTQKTFAEIMGKNESEVSKWLTGAHNFTLRTIAAIESKMMLELIPLHYKRFFEFQREIENTLFVKKIAD